MQLAQRARPSFACPLHVCLAWSPIPIAVSIALDSFACSRILACCALLVLVSQFPFQYHPGRRLLCKDVRLQGGHLRRWSNDHPDLCISQSNIGLLCHGQVFA